LHGRIKQRRSPDNEQFLEEGLGKSEEIDRGIKGTVVIVGATAQEQDLTHLHETVL